MILMRNQILSGKSVQVPTDYILAYDFNGNLFDKKGVNNGSSTSSPTYSTGRKGNDLCAVFNGNQFVRSTSNVVYSNRVSLSFWIKSAQSSVSVILESSSNINVTNGYAIFANNLIQNRIDAAQSEGGDTNNLRSSSVNFNNGAWIHVVMTVDRTQLGSNQNKVYFNAVDSTQSTGFSTQNTNNFASNILNIGQRNASTLGYIGSLQNLKIYNRILSSTEITQLYNE